MKNKTNRTLRKILSIALCLALVMSYIPMVSQTAFAADGDADEYTVTVNSTDANVSYYDVGIFANGGVIQKTNYSANETVTVRVLVTEGYVASVTVKDSSGEMISYTREHDIYTFTMPAGNVSVDISAVLCSHPTEAQGYVHSYDDQGNSTHHEKWCNECYSTIADSQEVHTFVNSIYKCDICGYSNTRLVITEASGEQVNAMNVAPSTALTATLFDSDGGEIEGVTYKWENFGNILHTGSTYTVPYDMVDSFVEVEAWLGEVRLGNAFVFCAEPTDDCQHNASENIYSTGNVIAIRCAACRGDLGMTATISVPDEVLVYTGAEQKVATVIYSDGWQENGNGELEILYEGDCTNIGTHKAIIWYQGVSAEISFKISCNEHYTEKDENKATCQNQAVCDLCGIEYGDPDTSNHDETVDFDESGFCPNCNAFEPATLVTNENYESLGLKAEYVGYYAISNQGQLYWFARLVNIEGVTDANAILTENVDLESRIWYPIGLYNDIAEAGGEPVRNQYKGTFDGNFHTVSNFTAIGNGSQGLLGWCDYNSANVMNLEICNAVVSGWNAGAVAGYGANLSNCYAVDCTITGLSDSNTSQVTISSLGGNNAASTIKNCYAYNCTLIVGAGEEYVMHPVGGVRTNGMGNVQNTYYGKITTQATLTSTQGAEEKSEAQFKSGEVAYLLGEAWGQMSNTEGSLPIITDNELYKVVTVGETGNYSVANVGDTNGDGTVDVNDYQVLVNAILNEDPEQEAVKQIETASYDDIVKYDLDGDGYLDVIDASLMHLFINGFTTVDVYAVGDYDLNGKAFEEADILAMAEAMENPETLATHEKYACDLNADGKVSYDDLNTLTSMFPLYFVGEA